MARAFLTRFSSIVAYGAVGSLRKTIALIVVIFWGLSSAVQAQELRIVAFGDSLTAGFGLPIEDGFTAQLEKWLRANGGGDVEVVNAGVSGDTTAGGLARVEWTLAEPADAMILELGANDMLRALDPALTRANLDGILKVAAAKNIPVFLAGMRAPGNYGDAYLNDFNSIFPDLAAKYDAWYYPQFLQGLSKAGSSIAEIARVIQPDGLHPNAQGVQLVVEDIGPEILKWVAGFKPK